MLIVKYCQEDIITIDFTIDIPNKVYFLELFNHNNMKLYLFLDINNDIKRYFYLKQGHSIGYTV